MSGKSGKAAKLRQQRLPDAKGCFLDVHKEMGDFSTPGER
jgi:hypothetical protein